MGMSDPVASFLESGGNINSIKTSAPTEKSDDHVFNFLDSGEIPDHLPTIKEAEQQKNDPKGSWWNSAKSAVGDITDTAGGVLENIASPVAQGAAAIPALASGIGNQLFGSEKENLPGERFMTGYNKVMDPVSNLMQPQTETGKNIQEGVDKAFDYLPEKAGDVAYENSGPLAGAAAKTLTSGAQLLIAGKVPGKLKELNDTVKKAIPEESKTYGKESEPIFDEKKTDKTNNLQDQIDKAQVLKRVGIDPEKVRTSSLTGDAKSAATDFQQSKLDNEGGNLLRQTFDKEKQALQNHAENIIKDTGGSYGMSEDTLHSRGTTIAAPFDSIRDVLNKTRKDLYEAADKVAGDIPAVKLDSFSDFLKKDSEFEGKAANGSLRKGINSYLREQNIIQEDGSLKPITAKSAEGLRQYINSQWSPETSGLAGKIKGLIDSDVLDNSTAAIYKPARDLHKKIKDTLENPNGISKLMDYDPRNPINRSVPYEKIPDFVTRLPTDQFEHIINVLKEAPKSLKSQSESAISEIKSHIVNKVLDEGNKYKGQWNSKGVSKILDDNSAKIKMTFSPEEISKLSDLNQAGKILSVDTSYPGAAVQGHNLIVRGAMKGLPAVGAGLGAITAGPLGAVAGEAGGAALASKIEKRSALSSVQKRFTNINDILKKKE